jgi:hypothetical protein
MDSMLSLSGAKEYLSGISLRPLWPVERKPDDPVCYPARYKNEGSFNTRLSDAYKIWCNKNSPDTIHGRGIHNNYPKRFLDFFAQTYLSIPKPRSGYDFVTKFNVRGIIKNRIETPAKSLEAKLGPIGVEVLDEKGRAQTAFPIAFLEIMQGVIEEHPSLKEDHLIAKAVLEYMEYLDAAKTTEACMDVSSLALQKKNLEAFRESGLFEQLIEQLTQ